MPNISRFPNSDWKLPCFFNCFQCFFRFYPTLRMCDLSVPCHILIFKTLIYFGRLKKTKKTRLPFFSTVFYVFFVFFQPYIRCVCLKWLRWTIYLCFESSKVHWKIKHIWKSIYKTYHKRQAETFNRHSIRPSLIVAPQRLSLI